MLCTVYVHIHIEHRYLYVYKGHPGARGHVVSSRITGRAHSGLGCGGRDVDRESFERCSPPNQGLLRPGRGQGFQESPDPFWNQQIMYTFWLFCAK